MGLILDHQFHWKSLCFIFYIPYNQYVCNSLSFFLFLLLSLFIHLSLFFLYFLSIWKFANASQSSHVQKKNTQKTPQGLFFTNETLVNMNIKRQNKGIIFNDWRRYCKTMCVLLFLDFNLEIFHTWIKVPHSCFASKYAYIRIFK